MTIDIDKAYDSINHSFLLCVFQKTGFRSEIIELIKILIKKTGIVCYQWREN